MVHAEIESHNCWTLNDNVEDNIYDRDTCNSNTNKQCSCSCINSLFINM